MQIIDLRGPQGNAFSLLALISTTDPNADIDKIMKDSAENGGYNYIVRKFEELCGHKYTIINYPAGYVR